MCPSGCDAAKNILSGDPVDAIVGKNVTIETLLEKDVYPVIIWNFADEKEPVVVATYSQFGLKVGERYAGRARIDTTNAFLHLSSLKSEDSGEYLISVLTKDGTLTAGIELRVLGELSPPEHLRVSQLSISSQISAALFGRHAEFNIMSR